MAYNLTSTEAILRARKYIDEQELDNADLYGESQDNSRLDSLIEALLPEAINAVHAEAPAQVLEATQKIQNPLTSVAFTIKDGVMRFTLSLSQHPLLRLVAFKVDDEQARLVTSVAAEDSAIGRMQLDKYVRGTYDAPVLILEHGSSPTAPTFRFYTARTGNERIARFDYIERYSQQQAYTVNLQLVDNYIHRLVGMVLNTYHRTEEAEYHFILARQF